MNCITTGCGNAGRLRRGMCSLCYSRWRNSDPPELGRRRCSVAGCEEPHFGKGYCKTDYARVERGDPPGVWQRDPARRYEALVDRSGGPDACHPWVGHRDPKGYGRFRTVGRRSMLAHRFGYQLHVGPLKNARHVVRHTCDNPPCQNPRHWLSGTIADNHADMVERGRHPRGESSGTAKLTAQSIRDIRSARMSGAGVRALARQYQVAPMTISRIVNGKAWLSVTGA